MAITTPTPGWTFVPNNLNNLPTNVPTNVTAYGTAPADYNQSQQLVICAAASFQGVVCDSTKDYVAEIIVEMPLEDVQSIERPQIKMLPAMKSESLLMWR